MSVCGHEGQLSLCLSLSFLLFTHSSTFVCTSYMDAHMHTHGTHNRWVIQKPVIRVICLIITLTITEYLLAGRIFSLISVIFTVV